MNDALQVLTTTFLELVFRCRSCSCIRTWSSQLLVAAFNDDDDDDDDDGND